MRTLTEAGLQDLHPEPFIALTDTTLPWEWDHQATLTATPTAPRSAPAEERRRAAEEHLNNIRGVQKPNSTSSSCTLDNRQQDQSG